MIPNFVSLNIDEQKVHVLKSIRKGKKGTKIKESDHNTIETEFNCKIQDAVHKEKEEFFNLKDKECQQRFKEYTSSNNMLSNIFDNEGDLNQLTEKFIKKLNGCIAHSFKKIRVSGRKRNYIETLYKKLREVKDKVDKASEKETVDIQNKIAKHTEENYNKLKNELKSMESSDGGLNKNQLWKLKKRLCPGSIDPPSAMLDDHHNLLTSTKAIQERAIEVFTKRIEANPIEEYLEQYEAETNKLCEERLKMCKSMKSDPWDEADLKEALKHLDKDKSRDPEAI